MDETEDELVGAVHAALAQALGAGIASSEWNESETRAHLIDPVLAVLGYRTMSEVRREYRLSASGQYVDYLLSAGETNVVVEAKAFGAELSARDSAQLVGYCAQEGIRWALLTNGGEWRIFDIAMPGNWEGKRIASLRLADAARDGKLGNAIAPLSLFRRTSLSAGESAIVEWAFDVRLRNRLRHLLNEPTSPVLRALQQQLGSEGLTVEIDDLVRLLRPVFAFPSDAMRSAEPVPVPPAVPAAPAAPAAPVATPATQGREVAYFVIPAADEGGFRAMEYLRTLLPKGMWGLRKSSGYRTRLSVGDRCAFYAAKVGVVATATIVGVPDSSFTAAEWPGPGTSPVSGDLYLLRVSDVEWLPAPVPLDLARRMRLEAFTGKDHTKPWSWFIQSTNKISRADFETITGRA